jgi:predicted NUDIX family phosphoesterase
MEKVALVIPHIGYIDEFSLSAVLRSSASLVSRSICETDENTLQLIPYITLIDKTQEEVKFFIYTRGDMSGENRLIGKCSIGLGGHIEESLDNEPIENSLILPQSKTLSEVIAKAAVRELEEEVGLSIDLNSVINALNGNNDLPANISLYPFASKEIFTLYNPNDAVGRVHLGIAMLIKATPLDFGNMEEGVITRGKWLTLKEIYEQVLELEPWSLKAINLWTRENGLP